MVICWCSDKGFAHRPVSEHDLRSVLKLRTFSRHRLRETCIKAKMSVHWGRKHAKVATVELRTGS
jgi:hypothetical protein